MIIMADKVEGPGKFKMVVDPVTGKKAIKFVPDAAAAIDKNIERPEPDLKHPLHHNADKIETKVDESIKIVEEREQQRPSQEVVKNYEETIDDAATKLAQIEKQQRMLEEEQRRIIMEEQQKQQSLGEVKFKIYMSSGMVYDNIMIPAVDYENFIETIRLARLNKEPLRILNIIIFNLDAIDYLEYE